MLDRPVFVLGCGRSGTTILARSIGYHRDVAYLYEPRDLWFAAFPCSDVWTEKAEERGGCIVLDQSHWTAAGAASLTHSFATAVQRQKRKRLCEKLPINTFRIGLLDRLFGDAFFVYVEREPLAVAESIAEKGWYDRDTYKWLKLVEIAEQMPQMQGLAARCVTPMQRGLLEWTLSTAFARKSLSQSSIAARVFCVQYEAFTREPAAMLTELERVCGLEHDEEAISQASAEMGPARTSQSYDDPVIAALLQCASTLRGEV